MNSPATINAALRTALEKTGLLQVVDFGDKLPHFWVLCRIVPGKDGPWLGVVEKLLKTEGSDADLVIARRYVLRDGRMVFGWHISLIPKSVKQLTAAADRLLTLLREPVDEPPSKPKIELTPSTPPRRAPLAAPRTPPRPRAIAPVSPPALPKARVPQEAGHNALRVVKESWAGGKKMVVQEMGLPHVYRDLNAPNAKGKGAKNIATDN